MRKKSVMVRWGKIIPGRGNSEWKGAMAGVSSVCEQRPKDASVTGD